VYDNSLSNNFNYDENIYAFYGILNNEFEKLSYQIGTRYEISDVSTELLNTSQKNNQNYANFFPSAFITYNLANKHKLQASYSRRIQRPRLWSLNPFFSISDSRNFWVGNPNLKPSYADSYELGYLQNFDKSSFYFGAYHRHSTNIEQRITSIVDTLGLNNVTITKPENLGLRNSMGIEMNGSLEISKWWNLNGNANFFYSNTEGTLQVENADAVVLGAQAYSLSTRLSNNLKFKKLFDAQVNLMYRAPQNTTQGKRLSMMSLDLGFSKDVLDKNGTFSLSIRDLFNTRKYRGITDLENYYTEYEYQRRRRQATLSFTYRLNQKKKRGGNRGGGYEGGDMDGY
jgi:outer membrane receptor protein involved in Fe transport